jgi:hypothetical protein
VITKDQYVKLKSPDSRRDQFKKDLENFNKANKEVLPNESGCSDTA